MTLILSGTDGVSDIDGTAATPAIRGTDANTGIFFPAADTIAFSEGGTEAMRINASGNLQTIGTISVGNATPSTSGAGITFPATQSASSDANTLDDYEEGTWTPGVTFGGGSTGMTFAGYQGGKYTKIGNRVFFTAQMRLTAKGSSTGTALLTGLPFASAGGNQGISSVSFFVDSLTYTNGVGGQVDLDATTISIYSMISGGGATALTNTEFANTTNVKMMGHYQITA